MFQKKSTTSEGDSIEKERVFNRRAFIVIIVNLIASAVVVVRLIGMQIFRKRSYQILSEKNQYKPTFIIPQRGRIFSSDGEMLAQNKECLSAILDPDSFSNASKILKEFANIADVPNKQFFIKLMERGIKQDNQQELILIENLTKDQALRIEYYMFKLQGVSVVSGHYRVYPLQESAAHIVGYVGKLKKTEIEKKNRMFLKLTNQNYRTGKMGVEKGMNEVLSGKLGIQIAKVNASRKVISRVVHEESVSGEDITLTLDSVLQDYAQTLVARTDGAITLMDIRNGNILAMTSGPSFDPNAMLGSIESSEWEKINEKKDVFINKCTSGLYSPGSVFKPVSALSAIEAERRLKDLTFFCTGEYKIGNRTVHCHNNKKHGYLNLQNAIACSCNCYFYYMSTMINIDKLAETARTLGFGKSYSIGNIPNKIGIVPDKDWKGKKFRTRWFGGETANTVMGQGYLQTTPLQMVVAASRIASNKEVMPNIFLPNQNTEFKNLGFSESSLEQVRNGMFKVFSHHSGTCAFLHSENPKYQMCGKTGTAQVVSRVLDAKELAKGKVKHEIVSHAVFIGYAPFKNPRFAVSAVIDHGGYGARAAIMAKDLIRKAIDRFDDMPYGTQI